MSSTSQTWNGGQVPAPPPPAALGPPGQKSKKELFRKTKLCRFFVQGMCSLGDQCIFAHGTQDLNTMPDFYRTRPCKFLINTGECKQPDCRYAHSNAELRSLVGPHQGLHGDDPSQWKSGPSGSGEAKGFPQGDRGHGQWNGARGQNHMNQQGGWGKGNAGGGAMPMYGGGGHSGGSQSQVNMNMQQPADRDDQVHSLVGQILSSTDTDKKQTIVVLLLQLLQQMLQSQQPHGPGQMPQQQAQQQQQQMQQMQQLQQLQQLLQLQQQSPPQQPQQQQRQQMAQPMYNAAEQMQAPYFPQGGMDSWQQNGMMQSGQYNRLRPQQQMNDRNFGAPQRGIGMEAGGMGMENFLGGSSGSIPMDMAGHSHVQQPMSQGMPQAGDVPAEMVTKLRRMLDEQVSGVDTGVLNQSMQTVLAPSQNPNWMMQQRGPGQQIPGLGAMSAGMVPNIDMAGQMATMQHVQMRGQHFLDGVDQAGPQGMRPMGHVPNVAMAQSHGVGPCGMMTMLPMAAAGHAGYGNNGGDLGQHDSKSSGSMKGNVPKLPQSVDTVEQLTQLEVALRARSSDSQGTLTLKNMMSPSKSRKEQTPSGGGVSGKLKHLKTFDSLPPVDEDEDRLPGGVTSFSTLDRLPEVDDVSNLTSFVTKDSLPGYDAGDTTAGGKIPWSYLCTNDSLPPYPD